MAKERKVKVHLQDLSIYSSNIDEWIAELTRIKNENQNKDNLRIEYATHTDEYDTYYRCYVVYDRPENPAEKAKREASENASKEWRRKQFEALKKEFENERK